jgi:hypothetical protein
VCARADALADDCGDFNRSCFPRDASTSAPQRVTTPSRDEGGIRVRVALVLLLVLLPAVSFAGCLAGKADERPAATKAPSAKEAGARDGPAPAAPDSPFSVQAQGATPGDVQSVTAYPVAFKTSAARAPVTKAFDGQFDPAACNPNGGGLPLGGLGAASSFHFYDLSDQFQADDVYSYAVQMTYNNTDSAWAELHLYEGLTSGAGTFWSEPTGDKRGPVAMNFTGQGYHAKDDQPWVGAACWYGQSTAAIPYHIVVTLTFAQGAVPAGVPFLVKAPANATRLFVRGVALDPAQGVLSHFRVFGADDKLVCECALGSRMETSTVQLPAGGGGIVVLVDHTSNGFVSLALDAPPEASLAPMKITGESYSIASSAGGALSQDTKLDFKTVPLNVGAWVFPPGGFNVTTPDAGTGKALNVTLRNSRGEVLHMAMASYVTFSVAVPGALQDIEWFPTPLPGEWSFGQDHHSFAQGPQVAHAQAETFRGEIVVFATHYVR